ncbi:putative transcription factor S-II (TFIIS), central domain [Lyophyllum shimeji]|uniref:Transcription elongation factor n=1 Tax=Lyophyllum shimeji TaxID=47721 RepID=A0A9P3URH9_LYOSH|nr:putative transcription factor S-II (TFIIS), central domain [Lyophyllum shimeji]
MSEAAELKKLVKQLQGASEPVDIIALLNRLKNEYEVTEALLRESKAGLAVGKLRQHASKPVSDLAKEVVKKWKTQVERAKKVQPNGKDAKVTPAATPVTPTAPSAARSAKTDGIKGGTGDNTRDKCVELLYDGLVQDSGAPVEQILQRAQGLEKAVHQKCGGTTAEYKGKIRSLFVNLKDKNNPGLRESVVSGELSVEKLAAMSSQEMASEERKAADRKIEAENFHNSLAASEQQAETDAFQCSRCKQRKCRYRQAQTRSADEPMTTFVTCTNCGNRWKFS